MICIYYVYIYIYIYIYIDIWIQYGELELANLDCIESLDSQPAVTCSKLTEQRQWCLYV